MEDKNLKELEEQVQIIMNTKGADSVHGAENASIADFHTRTASSLFGVKCQDVTKEQRNNAKAFNLGRFYNMGAEDLLELLDLEGK